MAGPRTAGGRQDWRTPPWLFGLLAAELGPFTVDAAADRDNHLVPAYLDEKCDARRRDLVNERVFVNPPYARADGGLAPWIEAFANWGRHGCTVAAVLPNSTDTGWFVRLTDTARECRLIVPRITFLNHNGVPQKGNMGGTMIGIWRSSGLLPETAMPISTVCMWDLRDHIDRLKASPESSWQFRS